MTALQGAFALTQVNHVPLLVSQNLKLNVPGVQNEFLYVDVTVTKGGFRLASSGVQKSRKFRQRIDLTHPLAASTGGSLD